MKAMMVTAEMGSAIFGSVPHLDSLLEYVLGSNHDSVIPQRNAPPMGDVDTPLGRQWCDEWLVPLCSSPIYVVKHSQHKRITRAFPSHKSYLLRKDQQQKVRIDTGPTKQRWIPFNVRVIDRVAWFCVASSDLLDVLREHVTNIGKLSSHGYGLVQRWTSEESPDYSWFADGVLMRPLPLSWIGENIRGYRKELGACCSPYWHRDRQTMVGVPV